MVPDCFAERIFKPINFNGSSFHYSGMIVIVLTYLATKYLNELKELAIIKNELRRLVVTFIVIGSFSTCWNFGIQVYNSFYDDLRAIYLNRERTEITLNGNDQDIWVTGTFEVVNSSNTSLEFGIKLKLSAFVNRHSDEREIVLQKQYVALPKTKTTFQLVETIPIECYDEGFGFMAKAIEYTLYNADTEVVFKGYQNQYKFD